MRKTSGGDLREVVRFQTSTETDDGYGNPIAGAWATEFKARARIMPKMGSEAVVAARMQGMQPYVITIRSNAQARLVTPAWRAINDRTGAVYDIKAIANPDERNAFLELLVTEGNG